MRERLDETFRFQLPNGLTDHRSTDLKYLTQRPVGQMLSRSEATSNDRPPKLLFNLTSK